MNGYYISEVFCRQSSWDSSIHEKNWGIRVLTGHRKHFYIRDSLISAFGNGLAPAKILNAIPHPSFSAALNSAP